MNPTRFPTFVYVAVAAAGALTLTILSVYFLNFRSSGSLGSQEVFGQFGDYVGGLLNPILSFVTLITILWSLRVQGFQLVASHEALQQAQALHREQLELQRSESIRNQLKQDADLYLENCYRLFSRPVFRVSTFYQPLGELLSLADLVKNPGFFGLEAANDVLDRIPAALKHSDALGLHLNTLRTQLSAAVYSVCNLMQYMEVSALRKSWEMRILSLVTDVRGVQILTEAESQEFLLALLGAVALAAKKFDKPQ
jgi:hypothetical protein